MTSKRDEVEDQRILQALLSCDREEYDDAAVQSLLERNPGAALGNNDGIILGIIVSALERGASTKTIRLICDANPPVVRGGQVSNIRHPMIHRACSLGASLEIVRLLYERWPDAVRTKDFFSFLPLHSSLVNKSGGASLEVVKFLVEVYPEALASKSSAGYTPLAVTCRTGTRPSDNLLKYLVEKYPNAVKESDYAGWLPLHIACWNGLSKTAVALLADTYPEALRRKCGLHHQSTPLHVVCDRRGAGMLDVVKALIERHPNAVEEKDAAQQTPLEVAKEKKAPTQVIEILTALQSLAGSNDEQEIMRVLDLFHGMEWPGGVALVIDKFPAIANKLDQSLMPRVLSMVGRRCSLNTFYSMFLENPALAKGAVKREHPVGEPPAKKARSK